MSLYSAGSSYRSTSGAPPGDTEHGSPPTSSPPATPEPSAITWARRRLAARNTRAATRATRTNRRLNAAGQRAEHQLDQLGPSWRVVEWPHTGALSSGKESAGFLAIGPGGVYAVTVVDQGRHRVMLAGEVVQIQGKRPPYVTRARKDAKAASSALTAAVGTNVPVVPVLTFVGSGSISAHGLPTGCLVVVYRELNRLLLAAGDKISPATAQKLAEVASHPATWADRYRWYPDSQTASDKGSARR